jgi:manganese oxidase
VIGLTVRAPAGARATPVVAHRRLRLLVRSAPNRYGDRHGYAFVSGDPGPTLPPDSLPLPGRLLVLERDQPVAITVVNQAHEPTAVHWHGIELESYPDGIPGWSGGIGRTLRAIAPRDSFVAEFTPPRSGTFMYHSHYNETQQIASGLYGAIVVLDPGRRWDPETDRIILVSLGGFGNPPPNEPGRQNTILVNGSARREPMDLRAGTTYRLRFINIMAIGLQRVTLADGVTPVQWRPVAKDGADLPAAQRVPTPAQFRLSAGEIADFELTPSAAGELRLLLGNPAVERSLIVIPVRVLAPR